MLIYKVKNIEGLALENSTPKPKYSSTDVYLYNIVFSAIKRNDILIHAII